jgi:hypothetical protein
MPRPSRYISLWVVLQRGQQPVAALARQNPAAGGLLGVQAGVDARPVRLDQRLVGGLSRVRELVPGPRLGHRPRGRGQAAGPVGVLHLHQQVLARHGQQRLHAPLDRGGLAGQRAQVHAFGARGDQGHQRLHFRRDPALDLAAPPAEQGARLQLAAQQRQRHHRLGQRAEGRADLDPREIVGREMDPPDHIFSVTHHQVTDQRTVAPENRTVCPHPTGEAELAGQAN